MFISISYIKNLEKMFEKLQTAPDSSIKVGYQKPHSLYIHYKGEPFSKTKYLDFSW